MYSRFLLLSLFLLSGALSLPRHRKLMNNTSSSWFGYIVKLGSLELLATDDGYWRSLPCCENVCNLRLDTAMDILPSGHYHDGQLPVPDLPLELACLVAARDEVRNQGFHQVHVTPKNSTCPPPLPLSRRSHNLCVRTRRSPARPRFALGSHCDHIGCISQHSDEIWSRRSFTNS